MALLHACRGLKADYILNTHHHFDHTGGNLELKRQYGATIVGPAADRYRIPGIDVALRDGDTWQLGGLEMMVFDRPGHTRGHITLFFPQAEALFPGQGACQYPAWQCVLASRTSLAAFTSSILVTCPSSFVGVPAWCC